MTRALKLAGVLTASAALAACGSSSTSTSSSAPAAGPATVGVQIDGKTPAFNSQFSAYFPNQVTVHPGDTVTFTSVFRGAPHTVTMGSLVNTGLDAYDKAAAANPELDEHSIPQLAKIPDMLPRGRGDANQATAQPCFLAAGDPPGPGATPCPQKAQPEFTGTETMFNSGWLPDQATFSVKLSSGVAPGTYRYMCALHRSGMQGKIVVVAPGQPVPSAASVKAAGDAQLQKDVDALTPAVTAANGGSASRAAAGVGSQTTHEAEATVFAPKDISIPVGGSVTWTALGFHTITFNAPESLHVFISKAPDGSVHVNPASLVPAGGPGAPQGPPPSPAPTPGGPPVVIDAGSWDGSGLHSSGALASRPPSLLAYKLTFSTAGTYKYVCLIHPDMEGTIKVG